ncbi:MAG: hypothetical protein AAGA58_02685 [Verrucomicrobiota bacterium]
MKTTYLIALACTLGAVAGLQAQAPSPSKPSSSSSKPSSSSSSSKPPATEAKVAKKDLRAVVSLTGYVEAAASTPIYVETNQWSDLTVESVVPHGKRVRAGDVLIRFRADKIAEQIADLENGRKGRKLTLANARDQMRAIEKAAPINMEVVERAKEEDDDNYEFYKKTDRADTIDDMKYMLRRAKYSLEYAEEELEQLLKMYEADDLTEETEEIIIERARRQVESAKRNYDSTKVYVERYLEKSVPRLDFRYERNKKASDLNYELSKATMPRNLILEREGLAKLEEDDRKAEKKLRELKADLAKLTVTAPSDGIVYYGASIDGRFTTGATVAKKLIPGGKVAVRERFMTIVQPEKVELFTVVPEDKMSLLRVGSEGLASPVSNPMKKFEARVTSIGLAPRPTGGFGAKVRLGNLNGTKLLPGMSTKLTFVSVNETDALTVPVQAVFQESTNGRPYVILLKDKVPTKRPVAIGPTDGKSVVIRKGLKVDDIVSTIPVPIPNKPTTSKKEAEKKPKKPAAKNKKEEPAPEPEKKKAPPKKPEPKKPAPKKPEQKNEDKEQAA